MYQYIKIRLDGFLLIIRKKPTPVHGQLLIGS